MVLACRRRASGAGRARALRAADDVAEADAVLGERRRADRARSDRCRAARAKRRISSDARPAPRKKRVGTPGGTCAIDPEKTLQELGGRKPATRAGASRRTAGPPWRRSPWDGGAASVLDEQRDRAAHQGAAASSPASARAAAVLGVPSSGTRMRSTRGAGARAQDDSACATARERARGDVTQAAGVATLLVGGEHEEGDAARSSGRGGAGRIADGDADHHACERRRIDMEQRAGPRHGEMVVGHTRTPERRRQRAATTRPASTTWCGDPGRRTSTRRRGVGTGEDRIMTRSPPGRRTLRRTSAPRTDGPARRARCAAPAGPMARMGSGSRPSMLTSIAPASMSTWRCRPRHVSGMPRCRTPPGRGAARS